MLVIAGRIRVKPERREDAVRLALDVSRETVKEGGLPLLSVLCGSRRPRLFFLFEEWDGPDALAQHFATPHMARFMTDVPALLAGGIEINRYEVSFRLADVGFGASQTSVCFWFAVRPGLRYPAPGDAYRPGPDPHRRHALRGRPRIRPTPGCAPNAPIYWDAASTLWVCSRLRRRVAGLEGPRSPSARRTAC
jgi:quinol monooxygenase YgiN